jgi:hypothetical protein
MREKIFEKWFYIASILAVFFGGVFWLTNLSFQGQASADDIKQIKIKADETAKEFEEIKIELAHIEDAVGAKK